MSGLRRSLFAYAAVTLGFALPLQDQGQESTTDDLGSIIESMEHPEFTKNGQLLKPFEIRHYWRFVGTSYGLSYSENVGSGDQTLKNVYMQPQAFEYFQETGEVPENTMFALLIYRSETSHSPRKQGFYQGELTAIELALKNTERFESGWAYYDFGRGGEDEKAAPFPQTSGCNSCHAEHGGHDNMFLQFYPELWGRGRRGR